MLYDLLVLPTKVYLGVILISRTLLTGRERTEPVMQGKVPRGQTLFQEYLFQSASRSVETGATGLNLPDYRRTFLRDVKNT